MTSALAKFRRMGASAAEAKQQVEDLRAKIDGNPTLESDRSMRGGRKPRLAIQENERVDRPTGSHGNRHARLGGKPAQREALPPSFGTTETTVPYSGEGVNLTILAAIVRSLPNLKHGLIEAVSGIGFVPQTEIPRLLRR